MPKLLSIVGARPQFVKLAPFSKAAGTEFEEVVATPRNDAIVVVGDVNATLACSVTAKKEWINVCHIEAGLRSGDIKMPEEVNRLVTDRLSDLLLTPDLLSSENLRKEGTAEDRIDMLRLNI